MRKKHSINYERGTKKESMHMRKEREERERKKRGKKNE